MKLTRSAQRFTSIMVFLDIIKLLKITTPADLSQDGKKYVIFCAKEL